MRKTTVICVNGSTLFVGLMDLFAQITIFFCGPMDPHTQISDKTVWKTNVICVNGSTFTVGLMDPLTQITIFVCGQMDPKTLIKATFFLDVTDFFSLKI